MTWFSAAFLQGIIVQEKMIRQRRTVTEVQLACMEERKA